MLLISRRLAAATFLPLCQMGQIPVQNAALALSGCLLFTRERRYPLAEVGLLLLIALYQNIVVLQPLNVRFVDLLR